MFQLEASTLSNDNLRGGYCIHGKYLVGRTIRVKAIGKENLVNKLQSMHMPNTFLVNL